jgi:type II secretory pathway component PulC
VRGRDIFNPLTEEKIEAVSMTDEQAVAKSKIAEAQETLTLVGIAVSKTGEPDAMIKDIQLDKVYFLKRGEKIKDFTVEAIFKNSVVLSYEGQELILK